MQCHWKACHIGHTASQQLKDIAVWPAHILPPWLHFCHVLAPDFLLCRGQSKHVSCTEMCLSSRLLME
jgi:hypothetical protein